MFAQLLSIHDMTIKNLEIQMSQLTSQMNVMSRGNFPGDTIPNLKRDSKEECKMISLRTRTQVDNEFKAKRVLDSYSIFLKLYHLGSFIFSS